MVLPWAWGGGVAVLVSGCRGCVHFLDGGGQVADVLVNVLVYRLSELARVVLDRLLAHLHRSRVVGCLVGACGSRAGCCVVNLRGDG